MKLYAGTVLTWGGLSVVLGGDVDAEPVTVDETPVRSASVFPPMRVPSSDEPFDRFPRPVVVHSDGPAHSVTQTTKG